MAIEATFTTTDGEFPLAAVFAEFPDAEIENISLDNVTYPGIHDIRVIDNVNGAAFIRIDWDLAYESVLTAIIETEVNLISALGREHQ